MRSLFKYEALTLSRLAVSLTSMYSSCPDICRPTHSYSWQAGNGKEDRGLCAGVNQSERRKVRILARLRTLFRRSNGLDVFNEGVLFYAWTVLFGQDIIDRFDYSARASSWQGIWVIGMCLIVPAYDRFD